MKTPLLCAVVVIVFALLFALMLMVSELQRNVLDLQEQQQAIYDRLFVAPEPTPAENRG